MIRLLAVLLFSVSLGVPLAYGEEAFPFLAVTLTDDTNVRAGQSVNFEKVYRLKKGEAVVVVEKSYSWYKIKLPSGAACFVSVHYVKPLAGNQGVVTADKVNLRAAANVNAAMIGRVMKDTIITILGKKGDWYQIEPLEGTYGWVADEFLAFKSKAVPPAKIAEKYSPEKERIVQAPSQPAAVTPKKEVLALAGRLEILETDVNFLTNNSPVSYKLLMGDETMYYVLAPANILRAFLHRDVKIEGVKEDDPQHMLSCPVISVERITLVL